MRVLVLCTGNSCRSQMAEGFLRQWQPQWEVISAGTFPASRVNPLAVQVMAEVGIDISHQQPKQVDQFKSQSFDYLITVCDDALQNCPVFTGDVLHRLHISFVDPAEAIGTEEELLAIYRQVRDEIRGKFEKYVWEVVEEEN